MKSKKVTVIFKIKKEKLDMLKKYCKEEGYFISAFVENAMVNYMNKLKKEETSGNKNKV